MIGTEFLKGQGLGNQLFCYATVRSIATELGYEFGTASPGKFANNIHNDKGMYFMDIDLGTEITHLQSYKKYKEREERIYIKDSVHDITHGCYISAEDETLLNIQDNTLIYGNLQSERYFRKYKKDFVSWFRVKPYYDSYEYTKDNLCIMNVRGGEYVGAHELYLKKKYWTDAMQCMKAIRSDMQFMIVTEDPDNARKMFPDIPVFHFGVGEDYVVIKNARYLILSNSSFACFPVFTSQTLRYFIAPKYWARHNVSDGFWASEQNIYDGWNYMDRDGNIFSAGECRKELEFYKTTRAFKKKMDAAKPEGIKLYLCKAKIKILEKYKI